MENITKLDLKEAPLSNLDISVCFAAFDDKMGPISIYHNGIAQSLASEVAVKVMIGSLSLHNNEGVKDITGESIIPFTKQSKIAFSYFFTIPASGLRGGVRSCALIVLMDADNQLQMYRSAPVLSIQCRRISKLIGERYTFDKPLSNTLKKKIDSLMNIQDFKLEIEEFYAARKITISKSKKKGSLKFLDKIIKKDLDKAIFAILLGKKVVVTGDEVMAEIAIASLEMFSPHKELRKVYWTNQIVEADLIGTKRNLAKAYEDAVIVDLEKGKILGGSSSGFCKNLLSKLKGLNHREVINIIHSEINAIISSATLLADLSMKKQVGEKEISAAAKQLNSEKIGIIRVIAKEMNPPFTEKIDKLATILAREASTYDIFA
ncbi:MAG: hypothetical protein GF308_15615 [Candidatus Heimdallarchaeota archaeon]|nr:hypothetical protein [Candidatus Heimdallarchaeota archaeon]